MKKRLFVHVGTEKTGTTSIQDFIASHKEWFADNGLTFLEAGTESNHHYWLAKALGFRFAPQAVDAQKEEQALADCREFINAHPDADLLLSSEHFDFNPSPENIANFVRFFDDYEITVILFLRDQVSYCQSLYAEHIKWGGILDFAEFLKRTIKQDRYAYLAKYRNWALQVSAMKVVDYNVARTHLINTFVESLGIRGNLPPAQEGGFNANPTPSIAFLNMVRTLNHGIPKPARRAFYVDLLQLATAAYPEVLERTTFTIPARFEALFTQEAANNRVLAERIGYHPETFLAWHRSNDEVFSTGADAIDIEATLRRFIFERRDAEPKIVEDNPEND